VIVAQIYTGFSHRFLEQYHKDYVVMFVHHIVTILLVAGSHSMNFHRIGILVLYVHDVSDITVDLLKLTNYLKLEGPSVRPASRSPPLSPTPSTLMSCSLLAYGLLATTLHIAEPVYCGGRVRREPAFVGVLPAVDVPDARDQ
jgi:hypothetical protein